MKSIKMITRHVDIPYISDTRQLNELYKAVFWYLTHDVKIDYNKEPYLQFVYNHKLLPENQSQVLSDLNIHKILSQNKTKDIKYKDYEITYWLTTENITVHADKDRIRENFKVQLTTKVPENLEKDILEEGDLVYLEPKRLYSITKNKIVLEKSMSLRELSQKEAVRLKKLMRKNQISSPDEQLPKGEKIFLR
jgi:hypothetical protein